MSGMSEGIKLQGVYKAELFRPYGIARISRRVASFFYKHGKLLHEKVWEDEFCNLVVNEGLQHVLDTVFSGGTAIDPWYLGLTDDSPTPAAGDTMASHSGWVEETGYTGSRQEWVEVRSGQTMTNAASVAVFPITGSATIGGAFNNEDATGTAGVLMSVGALTGGDRIVANLDTLNLTYTMTGSDV